MRKVEGRTVEKGGKERYKGKRRDAWHVRKLGREGGRKRQAAALSFHFFLFHFSFFSCRITTATSSLGPV